MVYRMRKQMKYIVFFCIFVIAQAQAIAHPPTVFLAERQDPSTDMTTTTAHNDDDYNDTSYSPEMSRQRRGCGSTFEGRNQHWTFDDLAVCNNHEDGGVVTIYCFENPRVDVSNKDRVD